MSAPADAPERSCNTSCTELALSSRCARGHKPPRTSTSIRMTLSAGTVRTISSTAENSESSRRPSSTNLMHRAPQHGSINAVLAAPYLRQHNAFESTTLRAPRRIKSAGSLAARSTSTSTVPGTAWPPANTVTRCAQTLGTSVRPTRAHRAASHPRRFPTQHCQQTASSERRSRTANPFAHMVERVCGNCVGMSVASKPRFGHR